MNRETRKLLIVDDVEINRTLLNAIFEAEGYTVVNACDGREALELIDDQRFDAVIADAFMPRMDGFELCEEIRSTPSVASMPFIMVSNSNVICTDPHTARAAGVTVFLRRPIASKVVVAAVRAAIDRATLCRAA